MARFKTTLLIALTSTALVGACGDRQVFNSWDQEAGAFLDTGGFGDATANNTEIQAGERDYVISLNQRFSAEVPTMVNFEFNSAVLDEEAQGILRKQADWIRQFPEVRFRVYGHTDLVGSDSYNKALGLRRARAVVSYLVSQGISRSRLEAMVSYGESQPLIVTQDRERRNRRTVTEVSGFLQNNSLVLNGKYAAIIMREYVASATELPANTNTGFTVGSTGNTGASGGGN
jgi:peptidoglycan-associated lipoprotein